MAGFSLFTALPRPEQSTDSQPLQGYIFDHVPPYPQKDTPKNIPAAEKYPLRGDAMPLTDVQVKNAKAGEKQAKMYDVDGLYLLVAPSWPTPADQRCALPRVGDQPAASGHAPAGV